MHICCVLDGNLHIFTTTQRDGPYKKKISCVYFSLLLNLLTFPMSDGHLAALLRQLLKSCYNTWLLFKCPLHNSLFRTSIVASWGGHCWHGPPVLTQALLGMAVSNDSDRAVLRRVYGVFCKLVITQLCCFTLPLCSRWPVQHHASPRFIADSSIPSLYDVTRT